VPVADASIYDRIALMTTTATVAVNPGCRASPADATVLRGAPEQQRHAAAICARADESGDAARSIGRSKKLERSGHRQCRCQRIDCGPCVHSRDCERALRAAAATREDRTPHGSGRHHTFESLQRANRHVEAGPGPRASSAGDESSGESSHRRCSPQQADQ
jgi:hypothetical protein